MLFINVINVHIVCGDALLVISLVMLTLVIILLGLVGSCAPGAVFCASYVSNYYYTATLDSSLISSDLFKFMTTHDL
jgi:hypothetical protein